VYGKKCPERSRCSPSDYGRVVRVKWEKDWRRFGPMPHGTQQRKRRYNGRTACERVNSRLKVGLMLGDLKVRGKARIELGVAIALVVLLGMAKGHLQRKAKAWRSLTRLAQ
jgi:IS5 family transposase